MTLTGDFVTGQTVSFQRMRALMAETALQEGVVGATDFQVIQRAAGANMSVDVGAGAAWVQIDTGTRNGLAHVYNDASANVVVAASNGTNPRIDQIVLRYNDATIPTGSGNVPTLETLTGTATSGATLDNRTGAAALPNDCLRLADILVPTSSTSVTTANIRDRRPWARGYFNRVQRASNTTTTSTTAVALDSATFSQRAECSGAPLRVRLMGRVDNSLTQTAVALVLTVDGAVVQTQTEYTPNAAAAANAGVLLSHDFVPAAGSHVFDIQWNVGAGTGTLNTAGGPTILTVEEIVRPVASNT